jgi:hypothetical protein
MTILSALRPWRLPAFRAGYSNFGGAISYVDSC